MPIRAKKAKWQRPPRKPRKQSRYAYMYKSVQWQQASKAFLSQEQNLLCRLCGKVSEVVDHEPAHLGDSKAFWDQSTWQPLCKRCHNRKSRAEQAQEQAQDKG